MMDNFELAERAVQFAQDQDCDYCDARVENYQKTAIVIENGEIENLILKNEFGIGIRILASGAWSFFSVSSPESFPNISDKIRLAVKNCNHYSSLKKTKANMAQATAVKDSIVYPVKKEPTLDHLIQIGYECDKAIRANKKITKDHVSLSFSKVTKYFANSDGSKIKQQYTDTTADLIATARESGITQSVNTTEGGRGGLEKISEKNEITKISERIAEKASSLVNAKPVKSENTTVVLNPDFVSLLTHEILGHPSEADRVLGKEMAWAGGAWWAGKLGEQIGSDSLTVFDDPTIEGSLGWYKYDDEGTLSTRTILVENGILKNHLQSRETAEIFHCKPTANMRATSFQFMPLIRMACTCIQKGDWDTDEMISEIKDGYLISNMKIPSIDMLRYNWSISCQYANKIENGEVKELVRDVIVMGTAPEFFRSIDACGRDFSVRPITNCGKGDPMQSLIMGNGGPSVRARATVKSVEG